MPDFNAWLGSTVVLSDWLGDVDRTFDTARVIAAKPTTITVTNRSVGAQTVRLEPMSTTTYDRTSGNAVTTDLRMLVLGYKGHPTIADTDLQRNDRFVADGQEYIVIQIIPGIANRLQAIAEATE